MKQILRTALGTLLGTFMGRLLAIIAPAILIIIIGYGPDVLVRKMLDVDRSLILFCARMVSLGILSFAVSVGLAVFLSGKLKTNRTLAKFIIILLPAFLGMSIGILGTLGIQKISVTPVQVLSLPSPEPFTKSGSRSKRSDPALQGVLAMLEKTNRTAPSVPIKTVASYWQGDDPRNENEKTDLKIKQRTLKIAVNLHRIRAYGPFNNDGMANVDTEMNIDDVIQFFMTGEYLTLKLNPDIPNS